MVNPVDGHPNSVTGVVRVARVRPMVQAQIEFVRLTEVPVADVVALLNEPRNSRHMPLASTFTEQSASEWVNSKDAQWERHGYGPWAVLVDGRFAGWGGFQHEDSGADYALVLSPAYWGTAARSRVWPSNAASRSWGSTRSSSRCRTPARLTAPWPASGSCPTARSATAGRPSVSTG
jgi:hypothetical protein